MTMTVTYNQMFNDDAFKSLQRIRELKRVNLRSKIMLARILRKIEAERVTFAELTTEIAEHYKGVGHKRLMSAYANDEQAAKVPFPVIVLDQEMDAFSSDVKKIGEQSIDVDFDKLKISDLGDVSELDVMTIMALDWLLDTDEAEN